MSGCNFRSDFIAAARSSQKHRFFCTSKPASTNSSNPDTHCQLIQRGDQSDAPFQRTLRGRVVKQSTVCIICTGYFFKHYCFSSAWQFITGFSTGWFSILYKQSYRTILALTCLNLSGPQFPCSFS